MNYRITHIEFDPFDLEDDLDGTYTRDLEKKAKSMVFDANSREELISQIQHQVCCVNITQLEYEQV